MCNTNIHEKKPIEIEQVHHLGGMSPFVHKMWIIIAVGYGIACHKCECEIHTGEI